MVGENLDLRVATLGILLATAVNLLVRGGISLVIGRRETGMTVLLVQTLASLVVLALAMTDLRLR